MKTPISYQNTTSALQNHYHISSTAHWRLKSMLLVHRRWKKLEHSMLQDDITDGVRLHDSRTYR